MSELGIYRDEIVRIVGDPRPYPKGRFAGAGIVVCAGGRSYFTCSWVLVNLLRSLGCELPIEVWHRGRREMSAEMRGLLESVGGVRCVDACAVRSEAPCRLSGWEIKPFAILHSAFEQVLYLDCDNVPIRDPSFLLRCVPYRRHGAIFWPDRWMGEADDPRVRTLSPDAWEACGLARRDEPEVESGQLAIHKRRCWNALQLTLFLNAHSDFFYRLFLGDKDTFHLAWRRVGQGFAMPAHRPAQDWRDGPVLYQHDFRGRRLFQHRNEDKWDYDGGNRRIPGFVHEDFCLACLDALRRRWDGVVRRYPCDYTAAERRACEQVTATRLFSYGSDAGECRLVELRPDFTIGIGRDEWETEWEIEEDDAGEVAVIIRGRARKMCVLRRAGQGAWAGRRLHFGREPVALGPIAGLPEDRRRVARQIKRLLPRLAAQDAEAAAAVARERTFLCCYAGQEPRQVELLGDHTVGGAAAILPKVPDLREGKPRGVWPAWWYVPRAPEGPELVLGGLGGPTCRLRRTPEGTWAGRRRKSARTAVVLVPHSEAPARRRSIYDA